MLIHCFRVTSPSFWGLINRQFDMKGGVYALVCKQIDGDEYAPIQRFLGVDKQGILYIAARFGKAPPLNSIL